MLLNDVMHREKDIWQSQSKSEEIGFGISILWLNNESDEVAQIVQSKRDHIIQITNQWNKFWKAQ